MPKANLPRDSKQASGMDGLGDADSSDDDDGMQAGSGSQIFGSISRVSKQTDAELPTEFTPENFGQSFYSAGGRSFSEAGDDSAKSDAKVRGIEPFGGDSVDLEEPMLASPKQVVHQAKRRFSKTQIATFTAALFSVLVVALVVFVVSLDRAIEEVMVCSSTLCLNGGVCRRSGPPGAFVLSCICKPGFEGETCELDIDECESSPCVNGGLCVATTESEIEPDTYACSCVAGFEGTNCHIDVDECASHPCQHFAECHHQTVFTNQTVFPPIGQFSCTCTPGFRGETCGEPEPIVRTFEVTFPCTDNGCLVRPEPADLIDTLATSLLIPSDDVLNLILHPNSNRDRERITFELRTDTVQQQRTIVRRMTTGRALPFGWQVDSATLGVCDFDQSGDATLLSDGAKKYQNAVNMRSVLAWTVHSAYYPRNILDCIRTYGRLQAPYDPDLYILEDVSGSFVDDMEELTQLAHEVADTLALMFDTYRVGIGTFVDTGSFCFKSDTLVTTDMNGAELTDILSNIGSTITGTDGIGRRFQQRTCQDPQHFPGDGEAVMAALKAVGQDHASLGFQSETLRLVLMSTDDYFRLGALGRDPAGAGYDTGCVTDGVTGQNARCERIPSTAEVADALGSSNPPILPIFAIADKHGFTNEQNQQMRQAYSDMVTMMGYNGSHHVMDLASDSSNFIEVLVRALRRLTGDLPSQCEVGNECLYADESCPNCFDTEYGPKICGECEPGIAKDLDGSCTVEIDECCSQPCLNAGVCTDAHISYSCSCVSGYAGENCDIDVNECDEPGPDCSATNCTRCHPLRSVEGLPFGGQCRESGDLDEENDGESSIAPGQYACVCPAGFTGEYCEVDIDECASTPCANSGLCTESRGVLSQQPVSQGQSDLSDCVFPFVYQGVVYNGCSYVGHFNQPWCSTATGDDNVHIEGAGNYHICNFDAGYSLDIYDNFTCSCRPGFSGFDCRIDIDECASQPCENDAICRQITPDSFFCECVHDYFGELCEQHEERHYLLPLLLALLAFLLCTGAAFVLIIMRRRRANRVTFLVETLDQENFKTVSIEVVLNKTDKIEDLMEELKKREGIPILEQRLFYMNSLSSEDGEMLAIKSTLEDAGICNGSTVKLMQVWQLKVHDQIADPDGTNILELAVVERHWRIESVMFEIETVLGIPDLFSSGELTHAGEVLQPDRSLPEYPSIENGSTLLLNYEVEEFEEEHLEQAKAVKCKPVTSQRTENGLKADSVLTMANMFAHNQVPGATLSELQNRAQRKSKPKRIDASNEGTTPSPVGVAEIEVAETTPGRSSTKKKSKSKRAKASNESTTPGRSSIATRKP